MFFLQEYFEEKILPHLPPNFGEVAVSPPAAVQVKKEAGAVVVKKEAGAVVVKKEAGTSSSLEVTRRLLRDDSDDEDAAAAAADTAFSDDDLPPMPSKTSGDSDAESSASSILNKDENKNRKKVGRHFYHTHKDPCKTHYTWCHRHFFKNLYE